MRWLLAIVLLHGVADAKGNRISAAGLGASRTAESAGWSFRLDTRIDLAEGEGDDDTAAIVGARVGIETWGAGSHWGFAMPLGYYAGAQVKTVRTTLGGGLGLWTFERDGTTTHFGIAPFLSASLETTQGELFLALDGRLARQVIAEADDYNVYSVMFMLGRRFK